MYGDISMLDNDYITITKKEYETLKVHSRILNNINLVTKEYCTNGNEE